MEVRYQNSVEKSVEPIMRALLKTANFSRMVNRRRGIYGFVGAVALMFLADAYLRTQSKAMLEALIFVVVVCVGVISGYRKLYAASCRKRIIRNLSDTDSLSRERILRISDKDIEIGSEKYAQKYSLESLDFCYEDDGNLVFGLKNGAVAAIGKEYFGSEAQFSKAIEMLRKAGEGDERI